MFFGCGPLAEAVAAESAHPRVSIATHCEALLLARQLCEELLSQEGFTRHEETLAKIKRQLEFWQWMEESDAKIKALSQMPRPKVVPATF